MKKIHLYEIDFMRGFIMLCVLSVHTMSIYDSRLEDWTVEFLAMSAVHSSMHVMRMAFMFITGLVLFITYYRRDFQTVAFWKKRLFFTMIPYVFWNIAYILFRSAASSINLHGSFFNFVKTLMVSLIHGDQFYIYYVLVTLQLYMIFPLMLHGLRKFEKYHMQIFLWSAYLQLAMTAFFKFGIPHLDTSHWPYLFANYGVFVLTYQCYFIAGGIAACHYDKIVKFIEEHARFLTSIFCASLVMMWIHYYLNRFILHESDHKAQSVHQPVYLPWALLVVALVLYLGRLWAKRRTERKWKLFSCFVMTASQTSFGMYLVQPFSLYVMGKYMMPHLAGNKWLFYGSLPFGILFVYFSSMLIAYIFYKTPILSYCIGRKSKFPVRAKTVQVPDKQQI
ncbi:acyltransferase [Weizmannia acidilactici]|uniref:Acyltransferase n=1 Tax=Weizmannia acidilactici TaxID=2607726 RepID=A0A5J4J7M2_9BACI|nr:acyltransferase [Weizmannia acidilactici]GER66802.1 acyltransferase [Weizmannia acidilactici]GER70902.1 acyltransferase [Weizmannia acidilactici]GER75066.1 acyltransferase [Weizmannia acidilactici]